MKAVMEPRKQTVLRRMCWHCMVSERGPVAVTQEVVGAEKRSCIGSAWWLPPLAYM